MCRVPAGRMVVHALALLGVVLLSACTTVGPEFKRPQMPSELADWKGGSLESLAADPRVRRSGQTEEWWRNFNDPVLDQLVAEAQRVNPSVRIAGMRIMEARAQLGIAGSTLYPQVQQATGAGLAAKDWRSDARDTQVVGVERRTRHQLGDRFLGQVQARHRVRGCRLFRQHRPVR